MYRFFLLLIASAGVLFATLPAESYNLKLTSIAIPPAMPHGLLLTARIDGGPPLRLLLDSGAEHLVIDRKAAARSGHIAGSPIALFGLAIPTKPAFRTEASEVTIESLTLRNRPLVVVDGNLLQGVDGVIPLSMFSSHLVHLDVRRRVLRLEPFVEAPSGDFMQAVEQRHLLFLEAKLDAAHKASSGFLLLDTGSATNIISKAISSKLRCFQRLMASPMLLEGYRAKFRVGTRGIALENAVTMDLSEMSARHGIDVQGVIGYPALSESLVSVDYRSGRVRIIESSRR